LCVHLADLASGQI